jgi:hypothetical protein
MSDGPDEPRRGDDGDVVVSTDLYKTVTVFSTLIAVIFVVVGFLFLDAATGAIDRTLWLGWVLGLLLPVPVYLAYRRLRSAGGTERVVVLLALYYVSLFGVPGPVGALAGWPLLVPGVPFFVRLGLTAAPVSDGVLELGFALFGLCLIGVGAGVYVLGTRFRTEGMRNPKDEAD